jgi:soluble lytic murein transglycosylase-like protein
MQIMPRTAEYMARGMPSLGTRPNLLDPAVNMTVGQRYVLHLFEHQAVEGDLFRLVAAYNGGPGNLAKWRRRDEYGGDPLLFIESIPSRETRLFIEKVLTSYWIYRHRLNQPTPSLDAIAAGEWPTYTPLDKGAKAVAQNGAD